MPLDPRTAPIEGRQDFAEALRQILVGLPGQNTRELWLIDEQFSGWPLDEPTVLDALSQWARLGGRQIHMVGLDFDAVSRSHPRFTAWRRPFGHAVAAWQPAADQRVPLNAVLLTSAAGIELLERTHWRARWVTDPAALRHLAENVAELQHRCEPAWPVTTLGL
jgi:hypothetical protein